MKRRCANKVEIGCSLAPCNTDNEVAREGAESDFITCIEVKLLKLRNKFINGESILFWMLQQSAIEPPIQGLACYFFIEKTPVGSRMRGSQYQECAIVSRFVGCSLQPLIFFPGGEFADAGLAQGLLKIEDRMAFLFPGNHPWAS